MINFLDILLYFTPVFYMHLISYLFFIIVSIFSNAQLCLNIMFFVFSCPKNLYHLPKVTLFHLPFWNILKEKKLIPNPSSLPTHVYYIIYTNYTIITHTCSIKFSMFLLSFHQQLHDNCPW